MSLSSAMLALWPILSAAISLCASATPTETVADCGSDLQLPNGVISYPRQTLYPSTANLSCDPGYHLQGNDTISCLAGGKWTPAGQCLPVNCGSFIQIVNGVILYPPQPVYQAIANLSCNPGYRPSGNASVTCRASGQWSSLVKCQLVNPSIRVTSTPTSFNVFFGTNASNIQNYCVDFGLAIDSSMGDPYIDAVCYSFTPVPVVDLQPNTLYHVATFIVSMTPDFSVTAVGNYSTSATSPSSAPGNFTIALDSQLSSVSLSWTAVTLVHGNGLFRHYAVSYSSAENGTVSTSTALSHLTIDGVLLNTNYTFSVAVVSEGGRGPEVIKTVFLPRHYTLTIVSAVPSPTSVSLKWTPVNPVLYTGLSHYYIAYQAQGVPAQTVSTTSTGGTITGLQFDTQYTINVTYIEQTGGVSAFTEVNVTTTQQVPLSPVIRKLSPPSGVSVVVTVIQGNYHVGSICAVIRLVDVSGDTKFARPNVTVCNSTMTNDSALIRYSATEDDSQYSGSFYVTNSAGDIGIRTLPITIFTPRALPSAAPSGFTVSSRSSDSLNLTWTNLPTVDWNCPFVFFVVRYHAAGSVQNQSRTTTSTAIHIGLLSPNTEYTFDVAFVGSEGHGPAARTSATTLKSIGSSSSGDGKAVEIGGAVGIFVGGFLIAAAVGLLIRWLWRRRRRGRQVKLTTATISHGSARKTSTYREQLRMRPLPNPKRDEGDYLKPIELFDAEYRAIAEEESPYRVSPLLSSEATFIERSSGAKEPELARKRQSVLPGIQMYGLELEDCTPERIYVNRLRPSSVPLLSKTGAHGHS